MTWKEAVFCAISNSKQTQKDEELCFPNASEEKSIRTFLREEIQLNTVEEDQVINEGRERAQKQKIPDGQYPVWMWLEFGVGAIGLIVNLINTFVAGFSIVFVLFLLVSITLVSAAVNCFFTQKGMRKAAKTWNQARETKNEKTMVSALKAMMISN